MLRRGLVNLCYSRLPRYAASQYYSTDQPNESKKKDFKKKYLALNPESPALASMVQKLSQGQLPLEIEQEIDSQKFTTDDLLRDLPSFRARHHHPRSSHEVGLSDLTMQSNRETLDMLHALRNERCQRVQDMFTNDQLKQYLRVHSKRVSGAKAALVNRIVDEVWGLSSSVIQTSLATNLEERRSTAGDGMTLTLGLDAWALFCELEPRRLKQIEQEFGVRIVADKEKKTIRASGTMRHVRGALSRLREALTARTILPVDLTRYGRRRQVSDSHVGNIIGTLNKLLEGSVLNYHSGEFFVRGDNAADAMEAQKALADALTEPSNTSQWVVAPENATATLVPAADPFGQPRVFVPNMTFFAQRQENQSLPLAVLAKHQLYTRPGPQDHFQHSEYSLVQSLRDWVMAASLSNIVKLSATLGKVMVDVDDCQLDPLPLGLYTPGELLQHISSRAPLFEFSSNTSPLQMMLDLDTKEKLSKQLVLRFGHKVEDSSDTSAMAKKYRMPAYKEDESLTVSIGVSKGKADMSQIQAEYRTEERIASVVVLQNAKKDLQMTVANERTIDVTGNSGLTRALEDIVHRLGMSTTGAAATAAAAAQKKLPCRHSTIAIDEAGQFGLVKAELVDRTILQADSHVMAQVRQCWDVLDDLRYSQVEMVPVNSVEDLLASQDNWERYLACLFITALKK